MCGISGAATRRGGAALRPLVERIVRYQTHRGPDAEGIQEVAGDGFRLVLGHNRLSIIDLAANANQPMASADGSLLLVFNGEIYNYKELRAELAAAGRTFRTVSDTEVLLQAFQHWGEGAFDRFLGMFAFALYDSSRQRLLLVRDRFGVKPIYYWCDGQTLAFASTPGIIADHAGLAPDLEYVTRGISFKYYEDEGDTAPFVGLHAVPPSHYVEVNLAAVRLSPAARRYYHFEDRARERAAAFDRGDGGEAQAELAALLDSACALRLRSDVPVGLSISGGLDSSSIAAVTAAQGAPLKGFSFGRPGDDWSEGPLVAELAASIGMPVSYVWPEGPDALEQLFHNTLRAQGAPFPHTSQMAQYAVFAQAKREGITVLLGGQGGDEAFMGYRKYFLFALQEIRRGRRFAELPGFATNVAALLPALASRAGLFWSERHRYTGRSAGLGSRLNLPALTRTPPPVMAAGQTIRDRQMLDITRYSLPSLLRYEDRNSMASSIESRLPFLDHRLLEFGVALPTNAKLRNGYGKHLLRTAMKGRVPDSIRLSRDKRGFDTRQEDWIRAGLGDVIRSLLQADRSVVQDLMGTDVAIDEAFSDQALVAEPQALKEAISLIWLANPLGVQSSDTTTRLAS
jgi:asparagine synthase (glutamine-hydrolysing)